MDPVDRTPYTPLQRLALGPDRPKHPKQTPRAFGASAPAGLHSLSQHRTTTLDCNPSARTFLPPISPIVHDSAAAQ